MEKTFTFKNDGREINNDVVYPYPAFPLDDGFYKFTITPRSKYWRFGIRIGKQPDIKFFHPESRYKRPEFDSFKDIHLGVGDWNNQNWSFPSKLQLAQYNFSNLNHLLSECNSYLPYDVVEFKVQFISVSNSLHISYASGGCKSFVSEYNLDDDFKYFQLFAWADSSDFELTCEIQKINLDKNNASPQMFETGNIIFRYGDMLDVEVILNSNVLLFPASSDGSCSPNIHYWATEFGIDPPVRANWGDVALNSISVEEKTIFVGYGYSLSGRSSEKKIIATLCRNLITTLDKEDDRNITGVSMPLFGTGVGNLNPIDIARLYVEELNRKEQKYLYIVSVPSSGVFVEIRQALGKELLPSPRLPFSEPIVLKTIQELGLNLGPKDYQVNHIGEITSLNLSDKDLFNYDFIHQLKYLRRLNLSFPKQLKIDFIGNLANLTSLYISGVGRPDFNELSTLKNLRILDISYNRVRDIGFLTNHKQLLQLSVQGNAIEDIDTIKELTELEVLDISGNKITDITPLNNLKKLNSLNLAGNQIYDADSLKNLHWLFSLDVSNNYIDNFSFVLDLPNLNYLQADKNIFSARNQLILMKDENHLVAIKNFLLRRQESDKRQVILPAKVILLGNHGTGKSSLLNYIVKNYLKPNVSSTHIVKVEKLHRKKQSLPDAIFFDFGGQDYYHGIYRTFLSGGAIYLLVWNLESNANNLRYDSSGQYTQDFQLQYWLAQKKYLETQKFAGDQGPLLLIQSYSDVDSKQSIVSFKQSIISNDFYVSLKKGVLKNEKKEVNTHALRYLKSSIYSLIREKNISKEEPGWYVEFLEYIISQNSLADHRGKSVSGEILKYYKRNNADALSLLKEDLAQLHKQGLVLYYQSEIPDTVWLNPVALVKYIHNTILNKKKLTALRGIIIEGQFKNHDQDILTLLSLQKVVFKHLYGQNGNEYILPNFLPLATDNQIDADLLTFGLDNNLFCLKFEDFLPFGLINQLICFFGKLPDKKKFWRDQLLFTFQQKAKILITLEFKSLKLKVFGTFYKNVKEGYKNEVVSYLFYVIMCLYWDMEILDFLDFISFYKQQIVKESYVGSEFYTKLENAEQIYTNEHCRPSDLFISLDEKYFIRYKSLYTITEGFINILEANQDNFLLETSKVLPVHFYQVFTNKILKKMKKLFISYSKYDEEYKEEFRKHLVTLRDEGLVESFNCKQIDLGADWDNTIQREVEECDIMICLVSVDFLNTDYIKKYEVAKAIENGKQLIPIIIKPCDWETSSVGKFFAADRGHTISLDKGLFLRNEIKENTPIERAAFWTKIIKEFREKLF